MKCEFYEKSSMNQDVTRTPKIIVCDGKVHGDIEPFGCSQWHASFHAVAGSYGSAHLQGFGDSPEEAFRNSFSTKKADLERQMNEVEEARISLLCEDILADTPNVPEFEPVEESEF